MLCAFASPARHMAAGPFAMVSHAERRAAMVRQHLAARDIGDPHVLRAMGEIPRERFVPEHLQDSAYEDGPLPIGEEQTISQPYIVAAMIQAAGVRPGDRVLEVGAGSGYAAAVLSRIASEVVAVERHGSLAEAATTRLGELGCDNCRIIEGDGSAGVPELAPFDAILVSAGAGRAPEPLKHQLTISGRLVIPVGGESVQILCRLTRTGEDAWERDELGSVRFVPLIGAHGRWDEEN
jgi:protein-L-isoaspartate(D-aspartate) O-methyltransferase